MEQFKQGLLSISSQFPKSDCCLEKHFVEEQKCLTYHDVRSQIVFHKTAEEGSNAAFYQENAIIEFELYLMSLSKVKMVFSWKTFCDLSQQLTGYQSWDSTKKSKCF